MEISLRKKFGYINLKGYSLSKIVSIDMNINNWRKIRELILTSKIIKTRNEISHDIINISIDQLLEYKKLLFDEGLLKKILNTKVNAK